MFGLVDRKGLRDSMLVIWIVVVPSSVKLTQSDGVRQITVYFVGRHVHERRFGTGAACSFQQIQSADRVRIEIIERNRMPRDHETVVQRYEQ